jgi:transcriptional regulator with XRE-family HTH domain
MRQKSIYSDDYKAIIVALADIRKKKGFTQSKIAKILGRPQSYIAKYEQGERLLDIIEFFYICKALETDPIRLLKKLI